MSDTRRITFPHMGDYWIAIKRIAEQAGAEVVVPPQITRRTIELGARYSPEFVCVPFKYTLGSLIEGIEMGASITATGMAIEHKGRLAIVNPVYQLR